MRRGVFITVGIASAGAFMIGLALVAIGFVTGAVADAWKWAVALGVTGSVLAAFGLLAMLIGTVFSAAANAKRRVEGERRPDPKHPADPDQRGEDCGDDPRL